MSTLPAIRLIDLPTILADARTPVLVEVWQAGCVHCKLMAPTVRYVASEFGNTLQVLTLEVHGFDANAKALGVIQTPTFILYGADQEIGRIAGEMPAKALHQWLASIIGEPAMQLT